MLNDIFLNDNLNRIHYTPPWWIYPVSIGFIFWGIYMLKVWRKSIDPNAKPWKRATTERIYLKLGIGLIVGGILFLIISIYQACTGWVAQF